MATHYAEMKCPHCSANGRVENDSNSPFMMGQCSVCGGYVVYFCGASLALDEAPMATHHPLEILDHIMDVLDAFLKERLIEFLDEYAEEFEIGEEPLVEEVDDSQLHWEANEPEDTLPSWPTLRAPSKRNPTAPPISADDLRNFRRIDLDGDRINTPENWS